MRYIDLINNFWRIDDKRDLMEAQPDCISIYST
jgi:hypothetical protein